MDSGRIELRVLVFKEKDGNGNEGWMIQCLDHDIAAQGKTLEVAKNRWERAVIGQMIVDRVHGLEPLSSIQPAPGVFWEEFARNTNFRFEHQTLTGPEHVPVTLPLVEENMRMVAHV